MGSVEAAVVSKVKNDDSALKAKVKQNFQSAAAAFDDDAFTSFDIKAITTAPETEEIVVAPESESSDGGIKDKLPMIIGVVAAAVVATAIATGWHNTRGKFRKESSDASGYAPPTMQQGGQITASSKGGKDGAYVQDRAGVI